MTADADTTSSAPEVGTSPAAAAATVRQTVEGDAPPPTRVAGSALAAIEGSLRSLRCWTLVLDDDPTGTQTVQGVPVLMPNWPDADLEWATEQPGSTTTFALTNSRSHDEATAARITYDVVRRAARIAARKDLRLRVISRSDSTLRGHFRAEVDAAHRALTATGHEDHGTVFVPAFLEAGRMTANDIQWVRGEAGFMPAADTEFARDGTFGYTEPDLRSWVAARLDRRNSISGSISLHDLRAADGVARAGAKIAALAAGQVLIANAAHPSDLEVLMLGLLQQQRTGRNPVIRSGPSFVRLCAGQRPSEPVPTRRFRPAAGGARHGLVVVGSHTALTNAQLHHAVGRHQLKIVELDAAAVVGHGPHTRDSEIARCRDQVLQSLRHETVILQTSREVLTEGRGTPLRTSGAVADALVQVVALVSAATRLRFLVAKGGITSSDMATRALRTRRAMVIGQMLPGMIPVWELLDGQAPGMPYVVFPGNVGADDSLSVVLDKVATP